MKISWGRSLGWNLNFVELKKEGMKVTQVIKDGCDCYPWREVYAWWPVKTITGKRIWLDRVFKRKIWLVWGVSFHMEPEVEYATMFEIIADCEERYNA